MSPKTTYNISTHEVVDGFEFLPVYVFVHLKCLVYLTRKVTLIVVRVE